MQKIKDPLNTDQALFLEAQTQCPLCSSPLAIRVEAVESDPQLMREEASCPNCDLLTRVKTHKVH